VLVAAIGNGPVEEEWDVGIVGFSFGFRLQCFGFDVLGLRFRGVPGAEKINVSLYIGHRGRRFSRVGGIFSKIKSRTTETGPHARDEGAGGEC
jgi:hypothetical protein